MSVTAIVSLQPRRRATVAGEIRAVRSFERPSVRTDVELEDGTAAVLLRFVGRRCLPGLDEGRRVVAEATPSQTWEGLVMLNPLYRFEPAE